MKRFKSVQKFDPLNQVPKMLKYVQDLIKVISKLNKQLFTYSTTVPGSFIAQGMPTVQSLP